MTDEVRGPEPWFLLTGDTLFVGSVGRPDLPGNAREGADELYQSVHHKIFSLPDDLEVYPGHFAGSACGVGMSGKPSTTLSFERRFDPLLNLDRNAFVERLAAETPEKPAGMDEILRFNRGEGAGKVRSA